MKQLPKELAPLAEHKNFVAWKWVKNEQGRKTKPPLQPKNLKKFASTRDPSTWGSCEEALKNSPKTLYGGIGFVLKGTGIGAIDIDDCISEAGEISRAALEIINKAESYTELTPSRRGVRVIGFVKGPAAKQEHIGLGEGSHCEVYRDAYRYITITGDRIMHYGKLANIDGVIDELITRKAAAAGKAKLLNGHGVGASVVDKDVSPSGLFHSTVCKWGERGWSIERMMKELQEHPQRYGHTSLARYTAQGRLFEEVVRSLNNAGLKVRESSDGEFRILSLKETLAEFTPPDYLVEGLLQRGFLYSLTGRTGSGKTSMTLMLAMLVSGFRGYGKKAIMLDGREVEQGRVIYFAGENPNDVVIRLTAMKEYYGFEDEDLDLHFVFERINFGEMFDHVNEKVTAIGGAQLVVIDTAAAYFDGDDENSNAQMAAYARQQLRPLTTLTGNPCVVVNCHPPKNVLDDNLQPRGGGAFVAEMDTNLTAIRAMNDSIAELHWGTKIRGADFNPIKFEFHTVNKSRALVDSKGRHIITTIPKLLTDERYEQREARTRDTDDRVLIVMIKNPGISMRGIAEEANQSNHALIQRSLIRLQKEKLVRRDRGKWRVTKAGRISAKIAQKEGEGEVE